MKQTDSAEITSWGRRIHGPTLPGQGVRCQRQTPLTPAEIDEVVAIIARGRLERHSVVLPERLKTRHWETVMAVMERLNQRLGWPSGGWKIGAAAVEVQRAEGVPGPAPGQLNRDAIFASPARLPRELFINYRCSECEFAFRMAADLPPRDRPYTEAEVAAAVEALLPALEIGDTVFDDWYGASGYQGSSMDNGGAAALVHGAPIADWRGLDLPNARIDLSLNGQFIKSGYGRAAMGHPLTSLTWLVNWLRERDQTLHAGEIVSTGTCTGHFFAAPGDRLEIDYGPIGRLVVD
ncbi:MAG: fumarylacetoacetate hydrolase family protein, partial [Chloroflexi bacterium]|nr:fumarylacetoacetate hydrolase family protein [Chloroflexota bacterium]